MSSPNTQINSATQSICLSPADQALLAELAIEMNSAPDEVITKALAALKRFRINSQLLEWQESIERPV